LSRGISIDVLEIVLARAANGDGAQAGSGGLLALGLDDFIHAGNSRRASVFGRAIGRKSRKPTPRGALGT